MGRIWSCHTQCRWQRANYKRNDFSLNKWYSLLLNFLDTVVNDTNLMVRIATESTCFMFPFQVYRWGFCVRSVAPSYTWFALFVYTRHCVIKNRQHSEKISRSARTGATKNSRINCYIKTVLQIMLETELHKYSSTRRDQITSSKRRIPCEAIALVLAAKDRAFTLSRNISKSSSPPALEEKSY